MQLRQIIVSMNQLRAKAIFNMYIIKEYVQSICGMHYPVEIVQIILQIHWHLFEIEINCGDNHNLLLCDGALYSWGSNVYGQLGLGHMNNDFIPQKIKFPSTNDLSFK